MSKKFTLIMAGMVAGIFLLGELPAYAIFGTRVARKVITARKAKQELAEDPDSQAESKALRDPRLKEQGQALRNS